MKLIDLVEKKVVVEFRSDGGFSKPQQGMFTLLGIDGNFLILRDSANDVAFSNITHIAQVLEASEDHIKFFSARYAEYKLKEEKALAEGKIAGLGANEASAPGPVLGGKFSDLN